MTSLASVLGASGRWQRAGIAAVVLVVVAVGLGLVGTPGVETIENRFTGVSENTTTVGTALTVSNPTPVGVSLGGTTIDYTVSMNDVAIASGVKEGIALQSGNTTVQFSTRMQNGKIPAWWVSHIGNGERTQVTIDATITDPLVGDRTVAVTQNRTVETDIMGAFNSTETRPVDADRPFVSDPVLYINETRGAWDRDGVTERETPLDIGFDVYNPKPVPYTVTKIGYTTYMNDVRVGTGETDSGAVILPGERETVGITTTIDNDKLDDWWVTHLRHNQNTTMYIDFYLVVEGAGEQFRIDVDAIDYETAIETDIFGNKAQYPTGTGVESGEDPTAGDDSGSADGSDGSGSDGGSEGTQSDGTASPSGDTPTDDGGLLGGL
ncbi:LEA type 2 family protein [Haloarcula onubensis]|uniref:LEA type 2 family protein n=1 Tax=Haloarcula onubensis TaxID=2950539 RepID=A0ABU2FQW0_9EURY|nr:LEA type 2 family protein [Halomicroarcula sp. S3CR25-11]MDS0283150.1 LEA type 2 family protein [Halomicroarcula sp. S3CR25-11]